MIYSLYTSFDKLDKNLINLHKVFVETQRGIYRVNEQCFIMDIFECRFFLIIPNNLYYCTYNKSLIIPLVLYRNIPNNTINMELLYIKYIHGFDGIPLLNENNAYSYNKNLDIQLSLNKKMSINLNILVNLPINMTDINIKNMLECIINKDYIEYNIYKHINRYK